MSYIAFDLDALNVVPDVAAACGVPPGDVAHGLLKLWAWCFRNKTATATDTHLAGFFGKPSGAALEAFGFLAKDGDGWRVRGAERYLRVSEGRSKGGHAAKSNLIPGGPKAKSSRGGVPRVSRGVSRASAERQPSTDLGLTSALTPSTEHLAPNERQEPAAPRETDRLCADFLSVIGSKYAWQGAKDTTAFQSLKAKGSADEISRRWLIGLKRPASEWASCRTVAQLNSKWNDLASVAAPFVSVEHQPSRIF